jgi:hypothetical protein
MTEHQRDLILKDIEMGGNTMSEEVKSLLPNNDDREMIKLTIKFYQKKFETKLYHQMGIVAQKKDVVNYANYYNLVKKYERDSNLPQPRILKGFYIDRDGIVHNINMKGGIKNG